MTRNATLHWMWVARWALEDIDFGIDADLVHQYYRWLDQGLSKTMILGQAEELRKLTYKCARIHQLPTTLSRLFVVEMIRSLDD